MNGNFLKARKIVLIFHGIDTFANVSLNDHAIGETSNMFLRYIFDVTDYIKVIKEIEESCKLYMLVIQFLCPEYAERTEFTESHISLGC